MLFKRFITLSLVFSLVLSSFSQVSLADGAPISVTSRVKNVYEKAKVVSPQIASSINNKLNTPAGKVAKGSVNKAALVFGTTIALLIAKEIARRLKEENLEVNAVNAENKFQEVDYEWNNMEEATHEALDAGALYPFILGAETAASKIVPKVATTKFAGTLLHSFIIGIVLTGFNNLTDKIFFLSSEYLRRHQDKFHGVTEAEQIKLDILEKRLGFSYFLRGLWFGDQVTKDAYRKLLSALYYTAFKEDEIRGMLWSHALREYALNGAAITTLTASMIGGSIRSKIMPDTATKFLKTRKTLFGFGVLATTSFLISEFMQDKITFLTRKISGLREQRVLDQVTLSKVSTEAELAVTLFDAKEKRQNLANAALSVAKIANDRVLTLNAEQKKIKTQIANLELKEKHETLSDKITDVAINSYQLLFFESPVTLDRFKSAYAKNAEYIRYYQSTIQYAFDVLNSTYRSDMESLNFAINTNIRFASALAAQRFQLDSLNRYVEKLSTTLVYQFDSENPNFSRDRSDYLSARRILDEKAFLGYFEEAIVPLAK